MLRLSVEKRLCNILGIESIYYEKQSNSIPFNGQKIINLINKSIENEIIIKFPVNIYLLSKILIWTNYTIHSGSIYYTHELLWVYSFLSDLFSPGEHIIYFSGEEKHQIIREKADIEIISKENVKSCQSGIHGNVVMRKDNLNKLPEIIKDYLSGKRYKDKDKIKIEVKTPEAILV